MKFILTMLVSFMLWPCWADLRGEELAQEPKRLNREDVFNRLTKNQWTIGGGRSLWLRRNGRYRWFEWHYDHGAESTGRWNFQWNPAGHGVILLAHKRVKTGKSHSAMAFEFRGDELFYRVCPLSRGKEIRYGEKQLAMQSDNLPKLRPPELFEKLTASAWKKACPFDLYCEPDMVRFDRDGRFYASYRDGECSHGGFWSIAHSELHPVSDSNTCDLRGGTSASIAASNSRPLIRDDFMTMYSLGNAYCRADQKTQTRTFAFDQYSESLLLVGRYTGEIQRGKPLDLSLTFEKRDQYQKSQLKSLRIESYKSELDKGSWSVAGPSRMLYEKQFDGVTIEPAKSHRLDVRITMPEAGKWISLTFTLDYATSRQSYLACQTFVTEVKP